MMIKLLDTFNVQRDTAMLVRTWVDTFQKDTKCGEKVIHRHATHNIQPRRRVELQQVFKCKKCDMCKC